MRTAFCSFPSFLSSLPSPQSSFVSTYFWLIGDRLRLKLRSSFALRSLRQKKRQTANSIFKSISLTFAFVSHKTQYVTRDTWGG